MLNLMIYKFSASLWCRYIQRMGGMIFPNYFFVLIMNYHSSFFAISSRIEPAWTSNSNILSQSSVKITSNQWQLVIEQGMTSNNFLALYNVYHVISTYDMSYLYMEVRISTSVQSSSFHWIRNLGRYFTLSRYYVTVSLSIKRYLNGLMTSKPTQVVIYRIYLGDVNSLFRIGQDGVEVAQSNRLI